MVIDTSAIIAILFDEPERNIFSHLIASQPAVAISVVTLYEASIVAAGKKQNPLAAHLVDELVKNLEIELVALDAGAAMAAREAYFRFGRGYHAANLNLADCFVYGLAIARGEPLLFKGDDFARTDVVPAWRP